MGGEIIKIDIRCEYPFKEDYCRYHSGYIFNILPNRLGHVDKFSWKSYYPMNEESVNTLNLWVIINE